MTLPHVSAWLPDYRTAHSVFASKNNARIDHIITLCAANALFICLCELELFKADAALAPVFLNGHSTVIKPDEDILARCHSASKLPMSKKLLAGNYTPLFMSSTASANNLGIICDPTPGPYTSTKDISTHYGLHYFAASAYFQEVGI